MSIVSALTKLINQGNVVSSADKFDPRVLELARQNDDVVEVAIDDFLGLAEEGVDPEKLAGTRSLLQDGIQYEDVPFLMLKREDDGSIRTTSHEGRHRALALKEAGYTTMPVRIMKRGDIGEQEFVVTPEGEGRNQRLLDLTRMGVVAGGVGTAAAAQQAEASPRDLRDRLVQSDYSDIQAARELWEQAGAMPAMESVVQDRRGEKVNVRIGPEDFQKTLARLVFNKTGVDISQPDPVQAPEISPDVQYSTAQPEQQESFITAVLQDIRDNLGNGVFSDEPNPVAQKLLDNWNNGVFSDDPNPVAQATIDVVSAARDNFGNGVLSGDPADMNPLARAVYTRVGNGIFSDDPNVVASSVKDASVEIGRWLRSRFSDGVFGDNPDAAAKFVRENAARIGEALSGGVGFSDGILGSRIFGEDNETQEQTQVQEQVQRQEQGQEQQEVTLPQHELPPAPASAFDDPLDVPPAPDEFSVPAGAAPDEAARMAGLVGYGVLMDGTDPAEVTQQFEEQMIADDQQWRENGRQLIVQEYQSAIDLLAQSGDPVTEDLVRDVNEWLQSPLGPYYGYVLQAFPTVSTELRESITAQLWMKSKVSEYAAGLGVGEIALDIAESFIPFVDFKDMLDADLGNNFVEEFQSLSPRDKVIVFPEIIKRLDETYEGRRTEVSRILQQMFSLEGAEDFKFDRKLESFFVGVDVASLAVPALRALYAPSAIKAAIAAGEARVVAELTARALADQTGSLLKYLELSREDAVQLGSPFRSDLVDGLDHLPGDPQFDDLVPSGLAPNGNRENAIALRGQFLNIIDEEFAMRPRVFSPEELSKNEAQAMNEVEKALKTTLEGTSENLGALRYLDEIGTGRYRVTYDIRGPVKAARTGALEDWELEGMVRAMDIPAKQKRELLKELDDDVSPRKILDDFVGDKKVVTDAINRYREALRERGIVRSESREYTVGTDNLGIIEMSDAKAQFSAVLSPIEYIERQAVLDAEILSTTRGKLEDAFNKMFDTAMAPVKGLRGRGKRKNVEAALDAWAAELSTTTRKLPNRRELAVGIETETGTVKLTSKAEQDAFYNMRDMYDMAYLMGNKIDIERLRVSGADYLEVPGVAEGVYGYVKSNPDQVLEARKGERVYDPVQRKLLTRAELKEKLGDDHVLAQLTHPIRGPQGRSDLVIVPKTAVKEPPTFTRPYINGYVPKINLGVRGVVRAYKPGMLNGVNKNAEESGDTEVLRFVRSKREGEQLAEQLAEENAERGWVIKYEPDTTDPVMANLNTFKQTGLFRGRRSRDEIRTGADAYLTKREPAFKALQRNLQHLSNQYPMHEWKLAQEQRFINSVNKTEGWNIRSFDDSIQGHPREQSLETLRSWLKEQFKFPTQEELWWERNVLRVVDALDNGSIFGQAASRTVMNLKDANPLGALRGAAFHSFLGFFNPAQLFVQAQAGSIALSLHPRMGTAGAYRASALWSLKYIDNEEAVRTVAKRLGLDQDDLVAQHKAWRRSGLAESVKNNADFNAVINGYTVGTRTVKKVLDKGLGFYRAGELAARSFAWEVATQEVTKRTGKKVRDLTDDDWREVFRLTQDYTLNMSNANRAGFQSNPYTSLGTQFLQVQTKFLETAFMNGRKLTPELRRRLWAMQAAIYGTAAVPFGNNVVNFIANNMLGMDPDAQEAPPWAYSLAKQGLLIGSFAEITSDGRVQFAERGAIGYGLEETWNNLWEANLGDVAFGAVAGLFDRVELAAEAAGPFMGEFLNEDSDWAAVSLAFGDRLASITSSGNNLTNAIRLAKTQMYYSKNANLLIRDPTWSEIIGSGTGFQLSRVQRVYEAMQDERAVQEALQEDVNEAFRWYQDMIMYGDPEDPDNYDPQRSEAAKLRWKLIFSINEEQQPKAIDMFLNKLNQAETEEERLFRDKVFGRLKMDNWLLDAEMSAEMPAPEGEQDD